MNSRKIKRTPKFYLEFLFYVVFTFGKLLICLKYSTATIIFATNVANEVISTSKPRLSATI